LKKFIPSTKFCEFTGEIEIEATKQKQVILLSSSTLGEFFYHHLRFSIEEQSKSRHPTLWMSRVEFSLTRIIINLAQDKGKNIRSRVRTITSATLLLDELLSHRKGGGPEAQQKGENEDERLQECRFEKARTSRFMRRSRRGQVEEEREDH
jgi:hypothetical protein